MSSDPASGSEPLPLPSGPLAPAAGERVRERGLRFSPCGRPPHPALSPRNAGEREVRGRGRTITGLAAALRDWWGWLAGGGGGGTAPGGDAGEG